MSTSPEDIMKPLSTTEFLMETQFANPATPSKWMAAVTGMVTTISVNPELYTKDMIVYTIQRLGLSMPSEFLALGVLAVEEARRVIDEEQE